MQRALLAGVLAVVTTSVVGTWVVMRGLSFLGDAVAHGVLPGIALAVVLGFSPTFGAVLSALLMMGGINLVHRRSRLSEDTGIGLLFVGMLALGVIIISRAGSYAGSLTGILFGDTLGVTGADIVLLAWRRRWPCSPRSSSTARSWRLPSTSRRRRCWASTPGGALVLLGLVTMAVVASFRTVGTLLVFGLLVAPPATAALLARRVPTMMAVSVLLGCSRSSPGCSSAGMREPRPAPRWRRWRSPSSSWCWWRDLVRAR